MMGARTHPIKIGLREENKNARKPFYATVHSHPSYSLS
jgi:hypothetical protein